MVTHCPARRFGAINMLLLAACAPKPEVAPRASAMAEAVSGNRVQILESHRWISPIRRVNALCRV